MNEMLKAKIDLLPDKPGSYQMKNADGVIIYVGKAKSLVKRVKQYFYRPQVGKVAKMVKEIVDFDIITTNTEKESLLLEINLIQKYYPKYNVLLKDGKMYPYIALKKGGDPWLKIARSDKQKGYYYFGPFPSSGSAYTMIKMLNKIFPLRKCKVLPKKPCLYYYLGQCLAPCIKKVEEDEYAPIISEMTRLLNGDSSKLEAKLSKQMKEAADNLNFEEASTKKDQLNAIKHIISSQKIMMQDHMDRDFVGYSIREGYMSIVFFLYQHGSLLGKSLFVVEEIGGYEEILTQAITQFYQKNRIPKELIIPDKKIQGLLEETLGIKVVVPQRGIKKDLLFMALENAKQGLDQHFQTARLEDDNLSLLNELGERLNINPPLDIELYDNSHFQGADAVGAMVKYINGVKAPQMYRKYNIQNSNKKDDLASMKEILTRRFNRLIIEKEKFPDLIILDGGENQIMAALDVCERLNIAVSIAGLKKNNKHVTEALINGTTGELIALDHHSNLFFFLMRMQDEVHRFAITTHRSKRAGELYKTIYDDIPGIGKKRKFMLLEAYPTVDSLKDTTIEELSQFIPKNSAMKIMELVKTQIKKA
jgi:excinuclease ABC subunit C